MKIKLNELAASGEYLNWHNIDAKVLRNNYDFRFKAKKWLNNDCIDPWYYWWIDYSTESREVNVTSLEKIYFKSEEDKVRFILKFV